MLFGNDGPNFTAWDAKTGKALWHSQIGNLSSPPETFSLDGKQRVMATTAGAIYMFILN